MAKHCVCVTGSRDWTDRAAVEAKLHAIRDRHAGELVVMHGAARGADTMAGLWAYRAGDPGISEMPFPAQWKKHGSTAGPIRNLEMATKLVELRENGWTVEVIAFPGPESKGTWHMVDAAKRRRIPVSVFENGEWRNA